MTSTASALMSARSSTLESETPVHSALLTAPWPHGSWAGSTALPSTRSNWDRELPGALQPVDL